jgi:adenylyltransferase/sulfurtransferase
VLGVLPGIIGSIQATEAIKLILGIGESLAGRFLVYDALRMRFRDFALPKDPDCPVCGRRPTIRELREYEEHCQVRLPPTPLRGYGEPGKPDTTTTTTTTEGATMAGNDMTVTELKARMDRGDAPLIIDVRQPNEFEICRIPGAKLIPLNELPSRIQELDPSQEIVLQCKVGGRSAQATAFLRQRGFTKARNLAGGILAWIDQIDPSQPKY